MLYLTLMAPFALMTRCHGTVLSLNTLSGWAAADGKCFRHTPTCLAWNQSGNRSDGLLYDVLALDIQLDITH